MGFTRTTRGLDSGVYDAFGSDTSASYDVSSCTLSITGGEAVSDSGYVVRTTHSSILCATARVYKGTTHGGGPLLTPNQVIDATSDIDMYLHYWSNSGGAFRLTRMNSNSVATLASSVAAWTNDTWQVIRLYRDGDNVKLTYGATALSNSRSASDTTYTGSLYGGFAHYSNNDGKIDWLDLRPAHTITCTGMTEGHYLRVSDGTTAAEAAASGAGLATVDAGAVLFPLATVQIRTAAAGGGDLIAELDTGDYADMGGGDAFAYSGAAAASHKNLMLMGVG